MRPRISSKRGTDNVSPPGADRTLRDPPTKLSRSVVRRKVEVSTNRAQRELSERGILCEDGWRFGAGRKQQLAAVFDPVFEGVAARRGIEHRSQLIRLTSRDHKPIHAIVAVPLRRQALGATEVRDDYLEAGALLVQSRGFFDADRPADRDDQLFLVCQCLR